MEEPLDRAAPGNPQAFALEYVFPSGTQVEIFKGEWLKERFAQAAKEKLLAKNAALAQLSHWQAPGLRVPILRMRFEPVDSELRLKIEGPFSNLGSAETVSTQKVLSGEVFQLQFRFRTEDKPGEGGEMVMQAAFRYNPRSRELTLLAAAGTFRIFSPIASLEDKFEVGPWVATAPEQIAALDPRALP